MIEALIFDFDGLILETELPLLQSWQELFDKYGLEFPTEKWLRNIGTSEEPYKPYEEMEQKLNHGVDLSVEYERRRQRELDLIGDQKPLPGVIDYLEEAKKMGLKIGLASSSSREWVTGHLSRLKLLNYFDTVRTKDDVQRTKPDPALFRTAVERLNVTPREVIGFEDSPNGILAAKRAGIYCVAVPGTLTKQSDNSLADLVLDSLEDLSLTMLIQKVEKQLIERTIN